MAIYRKLDFSVALATSAVVVFFVAQIAMPPAFRDYGNSSGRSGPDGKQTQELKRPVGMLEKVDDAETFLSAEELIGAMQQMETGAIWDLLKQRSAAFWEGHLNRVPLISAAAHSLSARSKPITVIASLNALLESAGAAVNTRGLLLESACNVIFASQVTAPGDVAALLRTLADQKSGLRILKSYIYTSHLSFVDSHQMVRKVASDAGWSMSDDLNYHLVVLAASESRIVNASEILSLLEKLHPHAAATGGIAAILRGQLSRGTSIPFDLLKMYAATSPGKAAEAAEAALDAMLSAEQISEVASQMDLKVRDAFLIRTAEVLASASPLETRAFASAFPATAVSAAGAAHVVAGLLRIGASEASQWLASLSPEKKSAALSDAISVLGSAPNPTFTPNVAKAWLEACSGAGYLKPEDIRRGISRASEGAIFTDFLKYVDLAAPADRSKVEDHILETVGHSLAVKDPASLAHQIAVMPDAIKERALPKFAEALALMDYQAALKWRQESDSAGVKAALDYALIGFGASDMPLSLRKEICLDTVLGTPDWKALTPAIGQLVNSFATTNPSEAFGIIEALPSPNVRAQVIPDFIRNWAERDPVAASEWLAARPADSVRDLAVKELVMAARDDPETALINAAGISDATLRLDAARSVVEAWKSINPQFLHKLLQTAQFAVGERSQLMRTIEN